MGRHKIQFSDIQIEEMERMAGFGLTEAQIAAILGVSSKTLYRRKNGDGDVLRTEVRSALERGKARVEFDVSDALVNRAKTGDVAAIRWYEMTRAGRTEKKHLELEGNLPPMQVILTEDEADETQPDSE